MSNNVAASAAADKKEEVKKNLSKSRVFVGNLAFKTTGDELKAHVAAAGVDVLSAEVISYPSGRSKGCGLVEFKNAGDADKASKALNNSELGGRKIFLREDREEKGFGQGEKGASNGSSRPPRGDGEGERRGGRGGGRGRGGRGRGRGRGGFANGAPRAELPPRPANSNPGNLYVGNLPFATTDDELKGLFGKYGAVVKAEVQKAPNGRSKGFGVVQFAKPDVAQSAINGQHDQDFNGRNLVVRVDAYAS